MLQLSDDNLKYLFVKDSEENITKQMLIPLLKVFSGELEPDYHNSLSSQSQKVIIRAVEELVLFEITNNFSAFGNDDLKELFRMVDQRICKYIDEYCSRYTKEEILVNLVRLGGILSYITLKIYSKQDPDNILSPEKLMLNSESNLQDLLDSLGLVLGNGQAMNIFDSRSILGQLKWSVDLGVNEIVLDEITCCPKQDQCAESINILDLIKLLNARLILKQSLEALLITGAARKKVGFDRSEGIRIPEIAINGFKKYTQATKNAKVDLYGESQDKMIEKFREYAGYSPNEFANYLNSSTAFRKNLMVTLSVTGLIEGDLILSHACNADGAKGVVRSLTLNNDSLEPYLEEMRKNDKKNGANYGQIGLAILLAGDSNFRLVRAPIMDCGAFQLVSPFMLSEAMASLRLRVLSRSVTPDNPRDISIVGKQFFDEAELKPIKEHLHAYRNLTAAINLDLQKDSALNKLFRNRKNVANCKNKLATPWHDTVR